LKKFVVAIAMSVVLVTPGLANAENFKIGFVDGLKLSQESPQAKEAIKRLNKEFEPRKNQLIDTQKQLREREEQFFKNGAFMSLTEKQKKEREIITAKRELKLKETEFREDLTIRQNEEMAKVQIRLRDAIQAYGKENGFDLILFEGVSFASEKANITDAVLKKLQ
jgi:outer membrane protein